MAIPQRYGGTEGNARPQSFSSTHISDTTRLGSAEPCVNAISGVPHWRDGPGAWPAAWLEPAAEDEPEVEAGDGLELVAAADARLVEWARQGHDSRR